MLELEYGCKKKIRLICKKKKQVKTNRTSGTQFMSCLAYLYDIDLFVMVPLCIYIYHYVLYKLCWFTKRTTAFILYAVLSMYRTIICFLFRNICVYIFTIVYALLLVVFCTVVYLLYLFGLNLKRAIVSV